jgi:hypothetical protein
MRTCRDAILTAPDRPSDEGCPAPDAPPERRRSNVAGVAAAAMLWPASDPDVVAHAHADLDPSHPHVRTIG